METEARSIQYLANRRRVPDPRRLVRQRLDANRYRVQHMMAEGRTWSQMSHDLAEEGVTDENGQPITVDMLRRTVKRARIDTDDPDPAAPADRQTTSGWVPVSGALERKGNTESRSDRSPPANARTGMFSRLGR